LHPSALQFGKSSLGAPSTSRCAPAGNDSRDSLHTISVYFVSADIYSRVPAEPDAQGHSITVRISLPELNRPESGTCAENYSRLINRPFLAKTLSPPSSPRLPPPQSARSQILIARRGHHTGVSGNLAISRTARRFDTLSVARVLSLEPLVLPNVLQHRVSDCRG
jgi:hypothetical protein